MLFTSLWLLFLFIGERYVDADDGAKGACIIPSVPHGYFRDVLGRSFRHNQLRHGHRARFRCEAGYDLDIRNPRMTSKTVTCSHGRITPMVACAERPCQEFDKLQNNLEDVTYSLDVTDVPEHGHRLYPNGTTATVTCEAGHKTRNHENTTEITCEKGAWVTMNPVCLQESSTSFIDCKDPGPLHNGYLQFGHQTTFSSVRVFKCRDFTTMEPAYPGDSHITVCQRNGQWSPPLPKCWGKCRLGDIANGYLYEIGRWAGRGFLVNELTHGQKIEIPCNTNDWAAPDPSRKVLECVNGTLRAKPCPAPSTKKPCRVPSYAKQSLAYDKGGYGPGEYVPHDHVLTITCPRYRMNLRSTSRENETTKCQDGIWSTRSVFLMPCKAFCSPIDDTNVNTISGGYLAGQELTLECRNSRDKFLENESRQLKIECQSDGTWDVPPYKRRCLPGCKKDDNTICPEYSSLIECTHHTGRQNYIDDLKRYCKRACGYCV